MDTSLLKEVPLFNTLTEEELSEVFQILKQEDFEENHKIFCEGDEGDKLYIVLSGAVRISKNIPGIGEEALCVLNRGDYFGEMALIDNFPRSADAISHEKSSCLSVSKGDLEVLMSCNKDITCKLLYKFVETLSKRLRETNDKLRSFFAMSGGF